LAVEPFIVNANANVSAKEQSHAQQVQVIQKPDGDDLQMRDGRRSPGYSPAL
jgi:hypothetical protein